MRRRTKERLQFAFALGILAAWLFVIYGATRRPELIALASVVTPVMLLPAGWLFTDGYLRERRRRRGRKDNDEEE